MKTSKTESEAFGKQPGLTPFYLKPDLEGATKGVAFMNGTVGKAFQLITEPE